MQIDGGTAQNILHLRRRQIGVGGPHQRCHRSHHRRRHRGAAHGQIAVLQRALEHARAVDVLTGRRNVAPVSVVREPRAHVTIGRFPRLHRIGAGVAGNSASLRKADDAQRRIAGGRIRLRRRMIVARRADLDNALFVQLGRLLVERRDALLVVSVKAQAHVHDTAAHVARLRQSIKDIENRRGGELSAVVVFTNAGKDINRRNGDDLVGERRASSARHSKHAAIAGLGGYDARHMSAMGAVEGHFVGAVQIAIASKRLEGHLARLHVGPNDLAASAHIEGALQIGMADRSARIEHSHFHGLNAAPRTCEQTPRLRGFHGTQIPLLAS